MLWLSYVILWRVHALPGRCQSGCECVKWHGTSHCFLFEFSCCCGLVKDRWMIYLASKACCLNRLTSNVWAGYSPRLLRARYSPSIYMCGSPKTRRYLLNKSSNTIIWRLNIRQVNKDLYVEVESPRQVVNQWENVWKCADYSMKKTCIILAWKTHVRIGWKYSKTREHLCI